MTFARLAFPMSLVASFAFAQTVQVQAGGTTVNAQTGSGGTAVKVQTGPGGASVDVKKNGQRTTVSTGAGTSVTTRTGAGSTTVQVGTTVDAPPPATVHVAAPVRGPAPQPAAVVVETGGSSEPYELNGAGQTELHTCGPGQTVEVNGSGHTLTLTGPCRSLTVNGSGHTVTVEMAGAIEVNGTDNNVIYRGGLGGRPAKVTRNGVDNTVVQSAR